jgi:hypothetical protein
MKCLKMSQELSIFHISISEKIKGIIKHKKRDKGTKKGKGSTKLLRHLKTCDNLRQLEHLEHFSSAKLVIIFDALISSS